MSRYTTVHWFLNRRPLKIFPKIKDLTTMRKNRVLHLLVLFHCYNMWGIVHVNSALTNNTTPLQPSLETVGYNATYNIMVSVSIPSMATQSTGIGINTKISVASTANIIITSYTLLTYQSSTASLRMATSSKDFTHSTNGSQKTHSTPPQTPTQRNTHIPTSKKPGKAKPILHKVGLIVGVVLGLVILSLCLIIFHKKEARVGCLRILCKPCTKNYSRYNIVPIYVYDDNDQDIRELHDDSDLPLV